MAKKLVILGAGESGVGAAILGKKQNYEVFVSDKGAIAEKYKDVLLKNEILFEENTHSEEQILCADVVVKSPGIPDSVSLIVAIKKAGIQVISEIEFGSWFTTAKLIGITGSNGKTTTSSLIFHLLQSCGLNVGLGGNIGRSFAWQVAENDFDYYVLELSSFQLDGLDKMKLNISVLLNITPDHLDRYDYNFDKYIDSKFQIVKNVDENNVFIYNGDDKNIVKKVANVTLASPSYSFSYSKLVGRGAWLEKGCFVVDINNKLMISEEYTTLKGKHNTYNIIAALSVANVLGLRKSDLELALKSLKAIEHRLESVLILNGVEYINDSKATNVDSTWYALDSVKDNIIWMCGGVDKGNDYSLLVPLVKSKVKSMICLGVDNKKLHEAFGSIVEQIEDADSAEQAVELAAKMASRGDTVLLSPACASFDLFKNYEDRGKQFKEAINKLNQ